MLLWAFGLVLVLEGLTLALLPGRLEQALALLARLSPGTRRAIGLGAVALGTALLWGLRLAG